MRRLVAIVMGTMLAFATFLTPLPDAAVASWLAVAQDAAGPDTAGSSPRSIRDLNYYGLQSVARGTYAFPLAKAGTPASVTQLYVMGSSDFNVETPYTPLHAVRRLTSDFDLFLSGTAGTSPLVHAIELSAIADDLPSDKAVEMVSPQWFSAKGVTAAELRGTLSIHQVQAMLDHPRLRASTKGALIDRLVAVDPTFCATVLVCRVGVRWWTSPAELPAATLQRSYARQQEERTEAKAVAPYTLPWFPGVTSVPGDQVDWAREVARAQASLRARSTNDLFLDDAVFERNRTAIESRKTSYPTSYHADSPAYGDLALVLAVARDLGIHLAVFSQPLNARWVDRLGFTVQERKLHYEHVAQTVRDGGGTLVDLASYEYDPYFFYDLIHIGGTAWLVVIRRCYEFARA